MRVLIVDDEKQDLQSLSIALRSKGFKVLESTSATQALGFIDRQESIHLVLTDYLMPGMDGVELLKAVRQKRPHVPVIMMTAYADKDIAIEALHNKCDGFLEKPFTLDQLEMEIKRVTIQTVRSMNVSWFSRLVPKIVHQINNPLMSITGAAELGMLELNDTETVRRCFEGILDAVHRIGEINRNILDMRKPFITEIKEGGVEIHAVLNETIDSFYGLVRFKGIEVGKEFIQKEVQVVGSRFAIEQLFKNLVMNAIDALEEKAHKRIIVKTELRTPNYISVYISDTGCGIPENRLDTIFKPFFTDKKEGNGLGLAVVKDIVESMNGRIEVKSKVGKGTIFRIDLPLETE